MKTINNPTALQQGTDPKDLFGFKLNYNTVDGNVNSANKLYNGNIAETFWSTATDGGFVRNYGYKYNQLNRLKDATYQKSNVVTNMYNENLSYDKNGNIMTLKRNGDQDVQTGTIGIDNLSYGYATNSNKLITVVDNSNNTSGFNDFNKTGNDYAYDANGNMNLDKNKKITAITYNHLNLPTKIVFGTTGSISYVYSATGQKVEKMVTQGTTITTTNYLNGYLYKNAVLQFFPTVEGYVEPNGSSFKYVYQYKDHLGNIRLSYTKNSFTNALDVIEENHYYPFGFKHNGYNTTIVGGVTEAQKIKFGSKEYQNELNLNVYDFGARVYNPEGGPPFWQIDPKAEQMRRWSPYSYAFDNPMRFVDPDGMAPIDWIENKKTGQIEWRVEVNSKATTPEGYEYLGKEYNGISIRTYESTSTATSGGLNIQVNYNGIEPSSDIDFMQTVTTNLPAKGASSPYNDPQPADDNKPFYYTDSEKTSYSDKLGKDLIFIDSPVRPNSKEGTTWSGELSVTKKSDGVHSIAETLNYGFEIKNGKSILSPIIVQPASDFQKKTLENYNKTLKKD
jgi:RHS repeat-associated protein